MQAEPDRTHLAVIAADVSAPPVGPAVLLHLQRTAGNGLLRGCSAGRRPRPPWWPNGWRWGSFADPRDKESGLDTDDLPGIKSYVVEMAGQGRRDLLNILLDRVRAKASDALATVQSYVDAAKFVEAPTKAVPDTVHVIWMGERIRKEAVDNIVSPHGKATRLALWTDSRKRGFLASPTAAPLVTLAEKSKTFAVRNVDDVIDKRLANNYALALQRNAYSMASDLARYSILLSQGGVYMDVDLSFRAVKSLSDLKMPEHGLPLLGPNIRDVGAQEQVLSGDVAFLPVRGDISPRAGPRAARR